MENEQHSLLRSLVLHLLPGGLVLLFFVVFAPLLNRLGFPSLFALFLAVAFAMIPFEIGYILQQSKKRNKSLSPEGVVLYREPVPTCRRESRASATGTISDAIVEFGTCN